MNRFTKTIVVCTGCNVPEIPELSHPTDGKRREKCFLFFMKMIKQMQY